jgi:carboxypeptidase Q
MGMGMFVAAPVAAQNRAIDIVRDLTAEIGSRLAGSASEEAARNWAVARLKAMGFSNVRIETFEINGWERGEEAAAVVSPYPQRLVVTALGDSGSTPPAGVTADVVTFGSIDALKHAPATSVRGKIVYVSHAMRPTQDGSSYGFFLPARAEAPNIAAKKGAVAALVRSVGTDKTRNPHTGGTYWENGARPIPAAALSNVDADMLEDIAARARGQAVRLRLVLTPRYSGKVKSGNVIAEVPGTDPTAGLVVIGGHLDSWDLGTGAVDDGAGLAITTAAAKAMLDGQRPRRTIRVVWWGAEEMEPFGGRAYFATHQHELHALVAEADAGAGRIWQLRMTLPPAAKAVEERLSAALAPLGIATSPAPASEGEDLEQFRAAGVASIDLQHDLTRYFDWHHTAEDTVDKVDPAQLDRNVAAWVTMLQIVANAPENLLREKRGRK